MSEQLFYEYNGKHLKVTPWQHEMLEAAFPHINVRREYVLIDTWLDANPRKRWDNQYRGMVNWFQKQPRPAKELTVGTGPSQYAEVRVKPEALKRAQERK